MLYTYLIQKTMSVVERQKLEEVLREQKTAYTGIIDLATAAQVGKLLGVEGVVVGSVADLGTSLSLTARLIDVEKGTAITAARVELVKTAELMKQLETGIRPIGEREGTSAVALSIVRPQEARAEGRQAQKSAKVGKPSQADQRLAQPLKDTAANLVQRAKKGRFAGRGGGDEEAKSLIAEYNLLVRKAKTLLKSDPYIKTLEETRETGHPEANAAKVGGLAKELEVALTSISE